MSIGSYTGKSAVGMSIHVVIGGTFGKTGFGIGLGSGISVKLISLIGLI